MRRIYIAALRERARRQVAESDESDDHAQGPVIRRPSFSPVSNVTPILRMSTRMFIATIQAVGRVQRDGRVLLRLTQFGGEI